MAILTAYPTAVVSADKFTTAQLGNVVGNTTSVATHNGSLPDGTYLGGEFKFDLSALPANAVINNIRAHVAAWANAAPRRQLSFIGVFANESPWPGYTSLNAALSLTATNTDHVVTLPGLKLSNAGHTASTIKAASTSWSVVFRSTMYAGVVTSWQKFWLEIDYALPSSPNVLFINELF